MNSLSVIALIGLQVNFSTANFELAWISIYMQTMMRKKYLRHSVKNHKRKIIVDGGKIPESGRYLQEEKN